jgi:hypothetical protein
MSWINCLRERNAYLRRSNPSSGRMPFVAVLLGVPLVLRIIGRSGAERLKSVAALACAPDRRGARGINGD